MGNSQTRKRSKLPINEVSKIKENTELAVTSNNNEISTNNSIKNSQINTTKKQKKKPLTTVNSSRKSTNEVKNTRIRKSSAKNKRKTKSIIFDEKLTEDIYFIIFSYLSAENIANQILGVCKYWNTIGSNDRFWKERYIQTFGDPEQLVHIPRSLKKVPYIKKCYKEKDILPQPWKLPSENMMEFYLERDSEDLKVHRKFLNYLSYSVNFRSHYNLEDGLKISTLKEYKEFLENEAIFLNGRDRCGDLRIISEFVLEVWKMDPDACLQELLWLQKLRSTTQICYSIALCFDLRMHDYMQAEKYYRLSVSQLSYFDFPGGDNSLSHFYKAWGNFALRVLHDSNLAQPLNSLAREIRFWT